jgi:poly(3-hydroxybutyrate) depolymerase
MDCVKVVLSALLLSSVASAAQDNGVVCAKQFKTTNNCYRLYKPVGPPRGLVVLLPYFGSDANAFSSAALPELLRKLNVMTMTVSASGYILGQTQELATLNSLITEVVHEQKIPLGQVIIGGVSAGGTGAIRYAEYCRATANRDIGPAAVVSVDAPLDFERLWKSEKLNLQRADPKSSLEESQALLDVLRSALGGSPAAVRQAYRDRSPFLASEKKGGNAQLLKNIPVRLYTEPDVVWMIENLGLDYYTINAIDQAALVLQLHALGNARAELITTTGKGFRPPGKRNPHSWSIVDEPELAGWISGYLQP